MEWSDKSDSSSSIDGSLVATVFSGIISNHFPDHTIG